MVYDTIKNMENIKKNLVLHLKSAVWDLLGEDIEPRIDHPAESHGEYSSNIALVGSKILSKDPLTLAEEIKNKFPKMEFIEKIEVAKPGFINFWISKDYLTALMIRIIRAKEEYGRSKRLENKKIMVEFTDPNPFKEFHIGHLYSNTVGESISRLLEANGAIVKRANYQGDIGMHIAKSLYAILQISNLKSQISNLEKRSVKERAEFLGECYAKGTKAYEEDENAKSEIEQLNKKIYDKDQDVMGLYEKGRQWSLEYFEEIYKRLGTKFDFYYFESEVGKDGLELVKEYLKKGVFIESKGAIIFPGERYNLHNRVFINSMGLPTYEAKELGLALRKYKDFPYDRSIIITGNEIVAYFKVLLAALERIDSSLAKKTRHISHGMVRLPSGKMSSRTGNVITGEWLIDETKRFLQDRHPEMENDILEKVTIGAVKYALLKSGIGRDIEFNFGESISLVGNSGPYLQYAFARTQSVVAKARVMNYELRIMNYEFEPEEDSLLRAIHRFPDTAEEAAESFAPNQLCNYLFDLSQKFNLFYQKHQILGSKKEIFRLSLTQAVGQILKNGLNLLGIQTPEKL